MTQAIIKKWENSLSVRLSVAIMERALQNVDDTVKIDVEDGRIIITPVKAQEYSIDFLLGNITSENIHEKMDFGKSNGKEKN